MSSPSSSPLDLMSDTQSLLLSSPTIQQTSGTLPSADDTSLGIISSTLRAVEKFKDKCYDRVLGHVSVGDINTAGDNKHIPQRKSRLQLVLLGLTVCGIDLCYSAETAFVSPYLLTIGLPATYMTLVWCLSPFFGFILGPILGSMSDRCQSRLGRRRPFILLMSGGIILGLILIPHGLQIGKLLGDQPPVSQDVNITTSSLHGNTSTFNVSSPASSHPWGTVFTVLGVALLGVNCDACQSPCRAYLLDVTVPEDHTIGLTTFTVMAGLGSSVGYLAGSIKWQNTNIVQLISSPLIIVFTLVLIMFVIFLILTITSTKEVPLSELRVMTENLQDKNTQARHFEHSQFASVSNIDNESEKQNISLQKSYGTREETAPASENVNVKSAESKHLANGDEPVFDRHMPDGTTESGSEEQPAKDIPLPPISDVSLKTYLLSIVHMPKSLAILCVTHVLGWLSFTCYLIFFTDFVGQAVFGGDPLALPGTEEHDLYEEGVRTGAMGLTMYSLTVAVYSLCIEKLVKKFSARPVYIVSQLIYTLGALVMVITRNRIIVVVFSPCAGIMYATLFTMPFFLVARYHSTGTFEDNKDYEKDRRHKTRGLGTDVALVNSMIFLAQFVMSACMGALVDATGTTACVMAWAAIFSFLGACAASRVLYLDL